MDQWLEEIRDALARTAGIEPSELELDDQATATVLDVARIAAHDSGERINAPLLCYLIGRAERGADLETLADVVRAAERV